MLLKNLNIDPNQISYFQGKCHDCGNYIEITVTPMETEIKIEGGALYQPDNTDEVFIKCDKCYQQNPRLTSYRPIEVYSRVVGYYRPISNWNKGKQQEFKDRKIFKIKQKDKQ